jgi:hypothetical protein
MGFPVEIETNAPEIVMAAAQAWSQYPCLSTGEPVRMRIVISEDRDAESEIPRVEFNGESVSIFQSRLNCAQANLATGTAEIRLTRNIAADPYYVNYHFLKPLTYLLLAPPHFAFAHASCVALNGRAVVLCGGAFAGKTCLAFACARRGWTFLSGDATHLLHDSAEFSVAGRPFSIRFRETAKALFPELRDWPAVVRPNGKASVEIETDRLELRTALRAAAAHFVFLERRAGGGARVLPVPRDETVRRLDEAVFFGDSAIREKQRATVAHFAALPAVRLEYSSLDHAEAALRGLSAVSGGG